MRRWPASTDRRSERRCDPAARFGFVISSTRLAEFALASFVLIVIPGPSVLFVIGRALAHGRRIALASVVGNALGVYVVAACVAFGPRCADPHSPKAVRASMGAVFSVALARVGTVAELPGERIALAADASEVLTGRARLEAEGTLLVGAERDGLPEEVMASCERRARIPIATESLNAAMAATVALYEMTRRPSRVPAS